MRECPQFDAASDIGRRTAEMLASMGGSTH